LLSQVSRSVSKLPRRKWQPDGTPAGATSAIDVELELTDDAREIYLAATGSLRSLLRTALQDIADEPSRGAPGRYRDPATGRTIDLSVAGLRITYTDRPTPRVLLIEHLPDRP
jgi:hypothetical protein